MNRRAPSQADVAEAWAEVVRLRRLAQVAAREAAERRRLTRCCSGDPLHPRAQGLAAAADFHEARAAQAVVRAGTAVLLAEDLEARHEAARGAVRCA
jgi:hypothetical protein